MLRLRRVAGLRCAAAAAARPPPMHVFDRDMKRAQRDRAAAQPDSAHFDYLRDEVARRLVDRLEDIKRTFPLTLNLGAATGNLAKALGARGGIETLLSTDISAGALLRGDGDGDAAAAFQWQAGAEPAPGRADFCAVADEEFLPVRSGSLDAVLSSMALHWTNDLPGVLAEVHRALRPDGCFLGAMLGESTLQELRSAFAVADMERSGGVAAHVSPFTKVRDVGDMLQGCGFAMPTVDNDLITVRYPDMFTLCEHLRAMGENNCAVARPPAVSRDVFMAAAAAYQALYQDEEGLVPATFHVLYFIGWKPHSSQPRPKARGSAKVSLADVL